MDFLYPFDFGSHVIGIDGHQGIVAVLSVLDACETQNSSHGLQYRGFISGFIKNRIASIVPFSIDRPWNIFGRAQELGSSKPEPREFRPTCRWLCEMW